MVSSSFIARYRFFRLHAGGWVGHSAEGAYRLAQAEERAEALELYAVNEEESEPYQLGDAETEAPTYVFVCVSIRIARFARLSGW